ncbi:MAG: ribosome silencing factor [Deltaproteobacteria bacterium]|nr:ribosome silencing factor [Deltaproteobacteria bacterium]
MPKKINKLFKTVVKSCQAIKAENIAALDLDAIESYADYIIIVSGNSDRQLSAIADRVVEDAYKKCKQHPLGVEGVGNSAWVLIDFGDVVCHVFLNEVRQHYRLEDMWPQVRPMGEQDLEKLFARKVLPAVVPEKKILRKGRVPKKSGLKVL